MTTPSAGDTVSPAPAGALRLHLEPPLRVERADDEAVPLSPRDAALLCWLAVEGPTTRTRLGALLWPASSEAQALTTLRQRLFKLKHSLGRDVAEGSPTLALADGVSHDADGVVELLGDATFADAPELDAWLRRQRDARREQGRAILRAQALSLETSGDAAGALALARDLLQAEPLSEAAHQRVMRLHYLAGDRAAALEAFDRCEQLLKDELGARPSAQTLALLATIERTDAAASLPMASRILPVSVLRPPRLVGRDRERAVLQGAWAGAKVAAVIGEAGMGKSRLLADALDATGVARAAARPGDSAVPFATLARLMRAVGDRMQVTTLAPDVRRHLSRVLPELGEAGPPLVEAQRLQLQNAIAAYLGSAEDLAGLVVDDLHFADGASVEMLQALIGDDKLADRRWALAWRPAESASPLRALQTALGETARLVAIELRPLDEAALAELVGSLGLGLDGAAMAPQLLRRTGGNPLFVLETLKQAFLDRSLSTLSDAGTAMPRPQSVEQLIDRRIGQLSPAALALARVASVAAVDFTIGMAESVLGTSAILLADALNELEAAQVLKGTYFAHDLVFDAVLRSVPKAIAEHTHGRVAAWLENHAGEPARIAQHWLEAGRPAQAVTWLEQAAARARHALRNHEELAFLDLRAGIEASLGRREAAFATGRQALRTYIEIERAGDACAERCDALERLADTPAQRIAVWLERSKYTARTRDPQAESWARRALAQAQALGDGALVRECQITLFEALTIADRSQDALVVGEACLGWIGEHDDARRRANVHCALAILYDDVGEADKGLAQIERWRELAVLRDDDDAALADIAATLAVALGGSGDARASIEQGLKAMRLTSGLDAYAGNGRVAVNLLFACVLDGQYAEALRWSAEAMRWLAVGVPGAVPLVEAHLALCYLNLGQRARTGQLLERIDANPAAILPARVRRRLIATRLARERGDDARPHIEVGLALLPPGSRVHLREALRIEAALLLPADEALATLATIAERAGDRGHGGHVLEAQMRCAQIALPVDPSRARDWALQALRTAQRYQPIASYRGELWLRCGEALRAAGDETLARRVFDEGIAWVRATARDQVPAEFQESFLHRNPVNDALLHAADGAATVGVQDGLNRTPEAHR